MRLRDGTRVYVRPIRPADQERLRAAFDQLSETSRYRRFFTPLGELSPRLLSYLTEVDHHDHDALVALVQPEGELIGVARYVRLADDSRVAEAAITVVDSWQGRGVGRSLLRRLARRAREEGIEQFSALVKVENPAAVELLRGLGRSTATRDGSELLLLVDLPEQGWGGTLARALRAAAAGTLSLADSMGQRLTGSPGAEPPSRPHQFR